MRFQEAYKRINGREPKTEEILKFERLTTALETTPDDALLCVLVALDHYETLYATIPGKITDTVSETLREFRASADNEATASIANAKADLAKAVSEAAVKVARNTATKQMWQWAAGCIVVAFLSVGLFGWYMHKTGHESGYSLGYGVAYGVVKDEKAAAAWANTPEGKLAYRLAQKTSIAKLAKCDSPGWTVTNGVCFVNAAPNGSIYGWAVP